MSLPGLGAPLSSALSASETVATPQQRDQKAPERASARSPGLLARCGQHGQADLCHWPPPEGPLGASAGSASLLPQLLSSAVAAFACGSSFVHVVCLWLRMTSISILASLARAAWIYGALPS